MSEIRLSQLRHCFQGIVPALICTHDQEGTPNISYLSHVDFVSEGEIALSNQFFSKTKRNVLATKRALLIVYLPGTLQQYELRLCFCRSETSGELFEKMALRLSIIAATEGKAHVYELLSSDIYRVESIRPRLGMTSAPAILPPPELLRTGFTPGEIALGFAESLNARSLGTKEAMLLLLKAVRFGLGFEDCFLYQNDRPVEGPEFFADHANVIRKVTNYGKPIMLSGLQLLRRYYNSLLPEKEQFRERSLSRQLAIPVVAQGKVLAVLILEDDRMESWDYELVSALKSMCATLALRLAQEKSGESPEKAPATLHFRFHEESETLFLNDVSFMRNLPAKILSYILQKATDPRARLFSNQEIICALQGAFPTEGKVNFEARLILIKKRLESRGLPLRLVTKGRGVFEFIVDPGIQFHLVTAK